MAETKAEAKQSTETSLVAYGDKVFPLTFPETWHSGKAEGEFLTTLCKDRPAGVAAIMNALNGHCINLADVLNTEISIAGITVTPVVKFNEETGEETPLIRVVMHCTNGACYENYSKGVMKSLRVRIAMFGDKAFTPPARCKPVRVPGKGSHSFYRLEWLN